MRPPKMAFDANKIAEVIDGTGNSPLIFQQIQQ